jgi:hypothetical protein
MPFGKFTIQPLFHGFRLDRVIRNGIPRCEPFHDFALSSEGVSEIKHGVTFVTVIASEAKQSSWAVLEGASFANAGLYCFPFASLWVAMTMVKFIEETPSQPDVKVNWRRSHPLECQVDVVACFAITTQPSLSGPSPTELDSFRHFSENLLGSEIFDTAGDLSEGSAIEQRSEEWTQRCRCDSSAQDVLAEIHKSLVVCALAL